MRFILGRSGTGKTTKCLNEIKENLDNDFNKPMYYIVPEQFSFEAEKKLIEAYRSASGDYKKIALKVLKGEYADAALKLLDTVGAGFENGAEGIGNKIGNLLGGLIK